MTILASPSSETAVYSASLFLAAEEVHLLAGNGYSVLGVGRLVWTMRPSASLACSLYIYFEGEIALFSHITI